jgi:hypothetical protein
MREAGSFGRRLHSLYPQLRLIIADELGAELAGLLAEPVVTATGDRIDWYGQGEGEPVALASLPAAQRQPVYEQLLEAYDRLEALAERYLTSGEAGRMPLGRALQAALVPPADSNVFLLDGHPVITFWGFFQDRDWGEPMDLDRWRALRRPPPVVVTESPPSPPAAPVAESTPLPSAPTVPTAAPPPPPRPALVREPGYAERLQYVVVGSVLFWSVFFAALLLLLIALLWYLLTGSPGGDRPPLASDSASPTGTATVSEALARARDTEAQLRARLDALRQQAGERVQCPPAAATQEFTERLNEAGATEGEITVTLLWNDRNDLDLIITCPSGERLYYASPHACGGTLDVDRNAERELTERPVENVYWAVGKAPPGNYRVAVHYYARRDAATPPQTDFQVRLLQNGQTSLYRGTVAPTATQPVTTFTVSR